jgi:hypothetical protein
MFSKVGRMTATRSAFVLCALIAFQGCQAPSQEWSGTWKLNPAKSSYQGRIMTISILANSEYRFEEKTSQTIRCDGKVQSVENGRTLVCFKNGIGVLDITAMKDGTKTRVTHDEVSADGRVLTTTANEFRPDGTATISPIVFSRLSGSDGLAGQWLDTTFLQRHTDMLLRLDKQFLHVDYSNVGQQFDAPLDGDEAPIRGHGVLDGGTFALQRDGPRGFLTTTKVHDKIYNSGSMKLSSDGRTITVSWWNPGSPDVIQTFVYDKM